MATIVLGVGGGIAAYKACLLLRLFTEAGHRVRVVPTAAALRFVGAPTWEALSGQPVTDSVFDDVDEVAHVRIGKSADLVVVAPATADLVARAANGLADDLLTNTLLTARCPVLFSPAMHTEMWAHPATVANVATLRSRGVHILDPDSGRLTGVDTGPGRLPEPEDIFAAAVGLLKRGAGPAGEQGQAPRDLDGVRIVVSAGGTREPLDPVRFLGNRSSGKQGYAIAEAAAARGADVVLVSVNASIEAGGSLEDPDGVMEVVRVETAADLRHVMVNEAERAEVVIMAAAVADFRPDTVATHKIKKSHGDDSAPVITLVRNPDILAELAGEARRPGQLVVGFAAETGDDHGTVLDHARKKLARKGCDLLVVNEVGDGLAFGTPDNQVTILGIDGSELPVSRGDKRTVAESILDAVVARLAEGVPR